MDVVRMVVLAVLMLPHAEEVRGETADREGLVTGVARVFSPEMRRTEERLDELAGELAELPELRPVPFASRYGFRSNTLPDQEAPHWVQIDLGKSRAFDRIVAVPAHIPSMGERGDGYGFPLRFKIEVADNPDMEGAVTVVDRTAEDVKPPGRYPMDFRLEQVQGRYLRFTSTRHFPVESGFLWALEELIVLSGNIVLSGKNWMGAFGATQASSSLELYPNWSVQRVTDMHSALGMPVSAEESPGRGYQSAVTNDHLEGKWLQVDLGRDCPIEEIRLLPLEAEGFETLGLRSFPRAWTVECANDAEFSEVTWRHRREKTELVGFPGGCAVVLSNLSHRARYVRLSTQELWGVGDRCGFGLAELQVYSGGENVALGKPVTAKDAIDRPESPGWGPQFVTDGFTSRHRLIEYPEYLDLIGQRKRLMMEQDLLRALRNRKVHGTGLVLGYGGGGLGLVAVLGWGWMLLRQRTTRRRAVVQLRDQIARDLHDDIGSNLGGIVLLSEMGSRHGGNAQSREDFMAIKEAAEETVRSMQDIVWLIQRGPTGLRDLVTRMRHSAEAILGEDAVTLVVEPAEFRDSRTSLLFRRHVFLAYKETLNNVRQHAGASAVEVNITVNGPDLSFEVRDGGSGFDPAGLSGPGHGLANLQRRAERLKGTCQVESKPGEGTRVLFRAQLRNSSQ